MVKNLSDIKDFLPLEIVENKKKNDLSKKKKDFLKKKNSQTSREVIGTQSMGNNERSTSRPSSSRECAETLRNTFLEQINGATLGLFSLTSPRVSKRSKLEENLAHRRDGKNYNNPKNYNLLSKWRRSLVSE